MFYEILISKGNSHGMLAHYLLFCFVIQTKNQSKTGTETQCNVMQSGTEIQCNGEASNTSDLVY